MKINMSTALANISNTDLSFLESVEESSKAAGITGHIWLSFSGKTGQYEYRAEGGGEDKANLPTPLSLCLNATEIVHGHVAWIKGARTDARMYRLWDRPKLETDAELPDVLAAVDPSTIDKRDGWSQTIVLPLLDPTTGVEYLLTASNKSSVNAVRKLIAKLGADIRQGKSPSTQVPVIKFGKSSFTAKDDKGKDIKVPVPTMTLEKWIPKDDISFSAPPAPTNSAVEIEGEETSTSSIAGPNETVKSKLA